MSKCLCIDLIVKCNKHLLWLIHNSFWSIKQTNRLILDLRAVNEHLWKQSVKFVNKVQTVLSPKGSTINYKNVIQPLTVHENPKNSVCGS
jgi:hypothetical protein